MPAQGRKQINVHVKTPVREKMDEIMVHHHLKGREHLSMTRVLETLIEREHKRLKL